MTVPKVADYFLVGTLDEQFVVNAPSLSGKREKLDFTWHASLAWHFLDRRQADGFIRDHPEHKLVRYLYETCTSFDGYPR
jgi:hypothetical protein